jgi:branched-chain amino acid transport system permease protein
MVDALLNFVGSLVIGIVSGSIYGLIALGIVLIYKTQKVVNFAQAEFATVAAFVLYYLSEVQGVPFVVAGVLAVVAAGLLAFVVERAVIRQLRGARDVTVFVATAGVGLLIISLTFFIAGAEIVFIASPFAGTGLTLGTFNVSPQQLLTIVVLLATAAALAAFFRLPIGRALLALASEPFAIRLAGLSVEKLSILVWVMAGVVAGIAGIVFAPNQNLVAGFVTTVALFPALTGAVLGGLNSLPGAFVGGLAVGIAQSLAAAYAQNLGIPGPDTVVVFVILLAVLFFRPQGLLAKEA